MQKDYYKILGIDKNASEDEIKRAFRKKAHQYHPDKNGGDEAKFKEVNEAYQVLSNKNKRQQYDQFGSAFDQAGQGGFNWQDFARSAGGSQYQNVNFDMGDLGDIFSGIFGSGFGRQKSSARSQRGSDIEMNLNISFDEAVFGTEKELELDKIISCKTCSGSGAKPGTPIINCSHCGGSGQIFVTQNILFGHIQTAQICPECGGRGKTAKTKCSDCHGNGIVKGKEKITFKIPAGINSGEIIRITGKGNASEQSGLKGDLYIHILVKESVEFARQGDDINSTVKILFWQAVLGDKIKVSTIHGPIKLKIPAGTASGTVFRLKGQGVPHLKRAGKGDHFVKVNVDVPKELTREQKLLINEMKNIWEK